MNSGRCLILVVVSFMLGCMVTKLLDIMWVPNIQEESDTTLEYENLVYSDANEVPNLSVSEPEFDLKSEFGIEYETIMAAASRNDCVGDNLLILFAVRKAENGPPGNEFGVVSQRGSTLNTQAGWAAATIMKNRERWNAWAADNMKKNIKRWPNIEGLPRSQDNLPQILFICYLGTNYCPLNTEVWVRNVCHWFERFKYGS